MELELGLKITRTREDVSSSVDFRFSKDPFGPLVLSQETNTRFIVIIHLKGFKKESIEIEINEEGNRITIRGRKPMEEMVMIRWMAWRKEVEFRVFKKVFRIPAFVDLDKIKARFDEDDTTLTITMPKTVKGISGFKIEEEEEERVEVGDHVSEAGEVEREKYDKRHSETKIKREGESQVLGEEQKADDNLDNHHQVNEVQDTNMECREEEKELADSNKKIEHSSLRKLADTDEHEPDHVPEPERHSEESKAPEIMKGKDTNEEVDGKMTEGLPPNIDRTQLLGEDDTAEHIQKHEEFESDKLEEDVIDKSYELVERKEEEWKNGKMRRQSEDRSSKNHQGNEEQHSKGPKRQDNQEEVIKELVEEKTPKAPAEPNMRNDILRPVQEINKVAEVDTLRKISDEGNKGKEKKRIAKTKEDQVDAKMGEIFIPNFAETEIKAYEFESDKIQKVVEKKKENAKTGTQSQDIREKVNDKQENIKALVEEEETAENRTEFGGDNDVSRKLRDSYAMKGKDAKDKIQELVLKDKCYGGKGTTEMADTKAENDKSKKVLDIDEQQPHEEDTFGNQNQKLIVEEISGREEVEDVNKEKKTTKTEKRIKEIARVTQETGEKDSDLYGQFVKGTMIQERELDPLNSQLEQENVHENGEKTQEHVENKGGEETKTKRDDDDDVVRKVQELYEPQKEHVRKIRELIKEKTDDHHVKEAAKEITESEKEAECVSLQKVDGSEEGELHEPKIHKERDKTRKTGTEQPSGQETEETEEDKVIKSMTLTENDNSKNVQKMMDKQPDKLESHEKLHKIQEVVEAEHKEKIIGKAELKTEEKSTKKDHEIKQQEYDGLKRSMVQDKIQETEESEKTREIKERRTKTKDGGSLRKIQDNEDPELSKPYHRENSQEASRPELDESEKNGEENRENIAELVEDEFEQGKSYEDWTHDEREKRKDLVKVEANDTKDRHTSGEDHNGCKIEEEQEENVIAKAKIHQEAEKEESLELEMQEKPDIVPADFVASNENGVSRKVQTFKDEDQHIEQDKITETSDPEVKDEDEEIVSQKETKKLQAHVQELEEKTENGKELVTENESLKKGQQFLEKETDHFSKRRPVEQEKIQDLIQDGKSRNLELSKLLEKSNAPKIEKEGNEKIAEVGWLQDKAGSIMKGQEPRTNYEDGSSRKVQKSKAQESHGVEKQQKPSEIQENLSIQDSVVEEEDGEMNQGRRYKIVLKTKYVESQDDFEEKGSDLPKKYAEQGNRAGDKIRDDGFGKVREIEEQEQHKKQPFVEKDISGKVIENKNQETKSRDDSYNEDNDKEDQEIEEAEVPRKLKGFEKQGSAKMVERYENRDTIKELVEEKTNYQGEAEDKKNIIMKVLAQSEDMKMKGYEGVRKQDKSWEQILRSDSRKDAETAKKETKRKVHQIKEQEETSEQERLEEQEIIQELVDRETEYEDHGNSKEIQDKDKEESVKPGRDEKRDKIQKLVDRETSEDDDEEDIQVEMEDEEEDWEAEVIQEMDSDEDNDKIRQIKRIRLGFRLLGGSTLFMSLIVIVFCFVRSKRKITC